MSAEPVASDLRAVDLAIARGGRPLLRQVNLHLQPGQLWLLCGPNGAGKSTLLEVLAGHRAPMAGDRLLDGRPVGHWPRVQRARRIALLPQDESPGYEGRVRDFVALGRLPWGAGGWRGVLSGDPMDAVVEHELAAFGLQPIADARLGELSGGQRQRARLAQLFAQRAGVLLLDEPGTHLDLASQALLRRRLQAWCSERGGTALVVVHPSGWPMAPDQRLALTLPEGRLATGQTQALMEAGLVEFALGCRLGRFRHEGREVWLPA